MHYYKLGHIPPKRHTQYRKPDGSLFHEEVFSTEGFSNLYSILYHHHAPTQIVQVEAPFSVKPDIVPNEQLKHRSFNGFQVKPEKDYLKSRTAVLVNDECKISLAAPSSGMHDYFFKNADADEIIFVHEGTGILRTMYGLLPFAYGDYLYIPRGTTYQLSFEDANNRLLIVESTSAIVPPKRYRNEFGQLLEHAPFCERDIRKPEVLETHDAQGEFLFYIKKQDLVYPYYYLNHPFDVAGWDGYV
ncbi:MAG: homogentisate 1,2-dioxygenase, partial [Saprospiraceae bacterium]|nr:homogentisate 1,2-dioxygenase [Saprospiraceae bacterium]